MKGWVRAMGREQWIGDVEVWRGDEMSLAGETVSIPVKGQLGAGSVERCWCPLAHQAVRNALLPEWKQEEVEPEGCRWERDGVCSLAGGAPCLFVEDEGHPHWQRVRESVRYEMAEVRFP